MKAWKSALLGAALLGTTMAAVAEPAGEVRHTIKYRCNGSKMVVVEYPKEQDGSAVIRLSWNNHHYRLTPAKVAQGQRYVSQQLIWSLLDEQARLTTRGGRVLAQGCREIQLPAAGS